MDGTDLQTAEFERHRRRLSRLAGRILGDAAAGEEAVQEAWLRLRRTPADEVRSLGAWLTTVVTRICLDEVRARSRRATGEADLSDVAGTGDAPDRVEDPERHVLIADSVGVAMMVVLERLAPAERVAFVLHDVFDLPFADFAPLIERSPEAARQLASRARRRIRGAGTEPPGDLARHRRLVEAFLAAARGGDMDLLLHLLAPDVVLRPDPRGGPGRVVDEIRGAEAVASFVVRIGARSAHAVLVDGAVALLVAPGERLLLVIRPSFDGDQIVAFDTVASPEALAALELSLLDPIQRRHTL